MVDLIQNVSIFTLSELVEVEKVCLYLGMFADSSSVSAFPLALRCTSEKKNMGAPS